MNCFAFFFHLPRLDTKSELGQIIELDDHDNIFWFGDLNYRIDNLSLNDTIRMINANALDELIKYDQLTNERRIGRVFELYNEGKVRFSPTYKYQLKSGLYEKQAQIKQNGQTPENDAVGKTKLPSWTDRVLWKSEKCELLQYSCVNTITISDHKPVYALFVTQYKQIDEAKLKKCVEKIHKDTDRKVNEERPRISVETKEFSFGECMYYDAKSQQLAIKNDGLTKCNVEILFHDPEMTAHEDSASTNSSNSVGKFGFKMMRRPLMKTKSSNQWVNIFPQFKEKIPPHTSYSIELTTGFNLFNLAKLNKVFVLFI